MMTEKRFIAHIDNLYPVRITGIIDKSTNTELTVFDEVVDCLNAIHEENEQLKSTIKEVTELLSDEVDLFSDKATEHDINAYRELQQLDNKDAYYMATAIKQAIKMLKGDVE